MKISKSVMFFTVFVFIILLIIFGEVPYESTISMNNGRLNEVKNFHATELNNDRALYVYLPPSYNSDLNKQYPVMYVQDGKGAFYLSDWSNETLSMHTTADDLISKGLIEELIIVGISNIGEQRISE